MSLIRTLPFSLGLFCAVEMFSAGAAVSLAVGDFTLSGVSLEQGC
ncbi:MULTISPECIES: hypothetical protein [Lonsdalea]|nr:MULTISPECIES: hypothetical protein [Lonsdalea]